MYNERRETFSFRSFFLTLLLLVLFILLMLFLFPTRWEFKKSCNGSNSVVDNKTLQDEIFSNNLTKMKEVARGYYTTDKLPKNINETKKMTLKEMYDKHLILKIKDKNGKECNKDKSYVEVTKQTDGYKLKVNLSCEKKEEFIIVNLSDYNTCANNCDKNNNSNNNKQTQQQTGKDTAINNTGKTNTNTGKTNTSTNTNTQTVVVNPQTTKVSVTGITVSHSNVSLKVGESIKLTVTVQPSNATNQNVSWSNSEPKVVKMSNGTITALSQGKSIITIKTIDGNKTATVVVTVTDPNAKTPTKTETKPDITPTPIPAKTEPKPSTNTGTTTPSTNTETKTPTVTYKCQIVSGKYYDSTGKVVTQDAYNKSCKTLYYQYKLVQTISVEDSNWSAWQTTPIKETSTLKVDTKTETTKKLVLKDEIINYEKKPVTVVEQIRTGKSAKPMQDKTTECCEIKYDNVKYENGLYSWRETTYRIVYDAIPIWGKVERYEDVTVTYYRSKKITKTSKTYIEWRKTNNDSTLLNKGYKLTGVTEYR